MTYNLKVLKKSNQAEVLLPSRKHLCFLIFACCFSIFPVSAASNVNIEQALTNYLNQQIQHYLQRHNMHNDKQQIDLFIPRGSQDLQCDKLLIHHTKKSSPPAGRVRLTVECESPKWQLRASAKVDLWTPLVVAKRDLQRAEILNEDLLTYRSLNIAHHLHGMETDIKPLLGMQVRRNVKTGDVITRRLLEKKYLINRDQHVDLKVSSASFTASVTAVALEDGQLGQRIKVKNLTSDAIIEGVVTAKGVVETSF